MKRILPLAVATALIAHVDAQNTPGSAQPAPKQTAAQTADAYYAKGLAAEKAGDPDAAKQAYEAALQANPKHAHARYQLGQVQINAAKIAAAGREARFGAVLIPEFNVSDATLAEALGFLSKQVENQSAGKVTGNFVVQDPKNTLTATKINLQLKNAPAKAIIKYLMEQSGARVRYDEFAIVVTPTGAPTQAAPEPAKP